MNQSTRSPSNPQNYLFNNNSSSSSSSSSHPSSSYSSSIFIKKSIQQKLKDQDRLISKSSIDQLKKSLESCQRNLSTCTFPENSESRFLLKNFEEKLSKRLEQLNFTSNNDLETSPSSTTLGAGSSLSNLPSSTSRTFVQGMNQSNDIDRWNGSESVKKTFDSIGSNGIVGFKKRLMDEKTFFPRSESLMAPMSMSESIMLQRQNIFRQRELETTEAMSRLKLNNSPSERKSFNPYRDNFKEENFKDRGDKIEEEDQKYNEGNENEEEEEEDDDDDEIVLTSDDLPDVERAWELAYKAGFSRGPGDLPQRIT